MPPVKANPPIPTPAECRTLAPVNICYGCGRAYSGYPWPEEAQAAIIVAAGQYPVCADCYTACNPGTPAGTLLCLYPKCRNVVSTRWISNEGDVCIQHWHDWYVAGTRNKHRQRRRQNHSTSTRRVGRQAYRHPDCDHRHYSLRTAVDCPVTQRWVSRGHGSVMAITPDGTMRPLRPDEEEQAAYYQSMLPFNPVRAGFEPGSDIYEQTAVQYAALSKLVRR